MDVKCEICGAVEDENKMIPINTGRVKYMCWACYKRGNSEAHFAEIDRSKRIERGEHRKEWKKK